VLRSKATGLGLPLRRAGLRHQRTKDGQPPDEIACGPFEEALRARKTLTVASFARTASERLFQRFARPEGKPLRHLRRALGAPGMTQQLFPLSARRQTPSLDAILSRLLHQPVLKRHRLTDSAPPFQGFRDGFVGRRAAHDALLEKAVSSGHRDRRSTGRPESVPLRAVEPVAGEVATCC
jgi:hypothetical protein